ncbi:MAG TPA: hypothetical protein PLV68_06305, partial [Ilumatobacteraceae bacterium]|nr:hypothetical protein [Ilumatobacteraceae bacterium]
TYTLVDTPAFDPSTTVSKVELISSSPSITAPAPGTTSLTVVSGRAIAGASPTAVTHTYRVRVTFSFTGSTSTTASRDCTKETGESGTGTFNVATVTPNIGNPSSD